jgi:predicted metalloprotease with PDZ domain
MRKCLTLVALLVFGWQQISIAQDQAAHYQYAVNLTDVVNDMINVDLIVPASIIDEEVIFHMPATVPGTYEILNFGQFVEDLKAFDKKNRPLTVTRQGQNTWKIDAGKKLYKITYKVNDTWDAVSKNPVFEPSGSNFDVGKCFVINQNACFGFFKGKENLPFEVVFKRPATFYGATALVRKGGDFDTDIYRAENYREFADSPLMYAPADTAMFRLGMSDIIVAVYSPNQKVTAKQLGKYIRPTIEAQYKYLGEILPVKKYIFIINLSPDGYASGAIGALEHSLSSMFCLVEESAEKIGKQVSSIAAHEFFHIVTPLYIHSEQIHNFDFMDPKMSQHLWFYEGVVEYMSQHVQVKYKIVSQEQFLAETGDKVRTSLRYKEAMSITEMSANCLVSPYDKQYNNVYYKGAMIGMCLDLKIMELSNGRYGLQDLMRELAQQYGTDTPFEDAKFFDIIYNTVQSALEITNVTPLKTFFDKHVKGGERIDYNEHFLPFGIEYLDAAKIKEISPLGGIENGALKTDSLSRFFISKYDKLDEFGKKDIGFLENDIILTWDEKPFNVKTVSGLLLTYLDSAKENDLIEVKVLRKNKSGQQEEVTLKTKIRKIEVDKKHIFRFVEKPTEKQLRLRAVWLEEKQG